VIPPEVFDLVNLAQLYLSDNNISMLPPEIAGLVNLRVLNLSDNQVPSTSDIITDLKARGVFFVI
jgi:internalin A